MCSLQMQAERKGPGVNKLEPPKSRGRSQRRNICNKQRVNAPVMILSYEGRNAKLVLNIPPPLSPRQSEYFGTITRLLSLPPLGI